MLTAEQLYAAINCIACIYALARITHCYYAYCIADVHPKAWYDRVLPVCNAPFIKKIRFGIASMVILGETLFGKSLAKLLVLCATGDVTDLVEVVCIRMKKVIIG